MSDKEFGSRDQEQSLGELPTMQLNQKGIGQVDRYELLEKLGEGGFGAVYGAKDTEAGILVALKALPAEISHDADEMASIRDNFALVSRLHHPHIASVLHLHKVENPDNRAAQAMGIKRGDYLVVMEYAPGATLYNWRRALPDQKMTLSQALEICRQIADALDYAHSQRVLHRDIKPKNVMVAMQPDARGQKTEDGGQLLPPATRHSPPATHSTIKVLDFGLAAEIRSSMSRKSKDPQNSKSGTPNYMAPEQWGGKRQDGRADQYALAALFYELVSGEVLFKSAFDSGNFEIMRSVVLREPVAPLEELTKQQNEVLQRALSKNPEERFGSCREFVDALAGVKGRTSKVKSQKAAITNRKSAMLIGLVVVGLLVVAAGVGVRWKAQRDTALAEQARDLPATVQSHAGEQQASIAKVDAGLARERVASVPDCKVKQEMERQWQIGETAWERERWQDAVTAYQETIRLAGVAQQMPDYFAVKAKYAEVSGQRSEISEENLKQYASTEYAQALALVAEAEGLEENPTLGKEKYEAALAVLSEAVKAAGTLVAEQKAVAEKAQRQKDYDAEMAVGKKAWDTADYSTAYKAFKKALVLSPGDAAAQTNYCQVDALLSRLDPMRTAKKGGWLKRVSNQETVMKMGLIRTTTSSTTRQEIRVMDVGEDTVMTRDATTSTTSGLVTGKGSSETVSERTQYVNEPFVFSAGDSKVIKSVTLGKDNTEAMKEAQNKIKEYDKKTEFGGYETIRVGTQEYKCKCLLRRSTTDYGTGAKALSEMKYWICEDTPVACLKNSVRVQVQILLNGNLSESETLSTCTLLSFAEESVTVNGQVLKCMKEVRQTEDGKGDVKGTYTSWECLDYPWLGTVKKETLVKGKDFTSTGSDFLEAFGLGP